MPCYLRCLGGLLVATASSGGWGALPPDEDGVAARGDEANMGTHTTSANKNMDFFFCEKLCSDETRNGIEELVEQVINGINGKSKDLRDFLGRIHKKTEVKGALEKVLLSFNIATVPAEVFSFLDTPTPPECEEWWGQLVWKAVKKGKTGDAVVQAVMDTGVVPRLPNGENPTEVHGELQKAAGRDAPPEVIEFLFLWANEKDFWKKTFTPLASLLKASYTEDVKLVKALLRVKESHSGASTGHLDVANALRSSPNINPNVKDEHGRTPLHWAALNGNLEMIKALLRSPEINPDAQDEDGDTPLLFAQFVQNNAEVEEALRKWTKVTATCAEQKDEKP